MTQEITADTKIEPDEPFEKLIECESPEARELARVAHYGRAPTRSYDSLSLTEIDRILTMVAEYQSSSAAS
ncbi:MAG: hypothetical protein AAB668_03810 [Patescibacteria group bacterium]